MRSLRVLAASRKVAVAVDGRSKTRTLRNGAVQMPLPALGRGNHVVTVRYLGTRVYAPSAAKPRTAALTS